MSVAPGADYISSCAHRRDGDGVTALTSRDRAKPGASGSCLKLRRGSGEAPERRSEGSAEYNLSRGYGVWNAASYSPRQNAHSVLRKSVLTVGPVIAKFMRRLSFAVSAGHFGSEPALGSPVFAKLVQ